MADVIHMTEWYIRMFSPILKPVHPFFFLEGLVKGDRSIAGRL
jgi:hypothetical protein